MDPGKPPRALYPSFIHLRANALAQRFPPIHPVYNPAKRYPAVVIHGRPILNNYLMLETAIDK